MADLLDDYTRAEPALRAAYAGAPENVAAHAIPPRPWDPALVAELRTYQTRLDGRSDFKGDEGVIITGQQPGIFTGPLYTIYKAITAVRLARTLREETGTPFVPVYWVGGDDHDFEEISQVHLLSKTHTAVPLRLEPSPGQAARSIHRIPVDPALHDLVDVAARHAAGSEFAGAIQSFLHQSLDAAENLAEWHARLIARLFRDTPLVVFTPDLPAARRAAIPVFEREIRDPLASTGHVNAGGARLEAAGYGAQVVKADDACTFFLEESGKRCRVRFADGEFHLPDTESSYTREQLLDLLHREPGRFTANVALRCIVQQHLFPARAYVAGPGELAYWGQLKDLFGYFDLPMPVVYPRARAVLTSVKTNKLLRKYGLAPADLNGAALDLEERALRAGEPHPALEVLARHRAALEAEAVAMKDDFQALGKPGKAAADPAGQFEATVRQGLDHLERQLLRADENRTETVRNQLARLATELAPERKPQERYYTLFSWLFQHGWDLVPRLADALDHRDFSLHEVEL